MARAQKRLSVGNPKGVSDAEYRASNVLQSCGIQASPVPVERIAVQLGLSLEHVHLGDDVSGLLVVQDGRGVIGVNSSQSITRQRFTIAHEIGHFLLHPTAMPVFIDKSFLKPYFTAFRNTTSSTGEDRLEREANSFAAALLMPATLIQQAVSELPADLPDEEEVEQLARRFKVSRQAMSFRLARLAASDADHFPEIG